MEDPQRRVLPNGGGDPEVKVGSEPVFASHPSIQSPTVVHESPQYIVVAESPPPPLPPNPVGPISPRLSPRRGAYMERVQGIGGVIRPSRGGGSGGGHSSSGVAPAPVAARPTPPFCQALVPPWPGGLLAEAVVGHLLLMGVEVPRLDILGTPLKHGKSLT